MTPITAILSFAVGAASMLLLLNFLSRKPRYYRGPNGLKASAKGPRTDYELTTLQSRGWTQISEREYRE